MKNENRLKFVILSILLLFLWFCCLRNHILAVQDTRPILIQEFDKFYSLMDRHLAATCAKDVRKDSEVMYKNIREQIETLIKESE